MRAIDLAATSFVTDDDTEHDVTPLISGTRLSDFVLDAPIAEGGMARIWRAKTTAGGSVALKVLLDRHRKDEEVAAMFEHELVLAKRLVHQNVVRTLGIHEAGGRKFSSMELLTGVSALAFLKRQWKKKALLPPALPIYIAAKLASAMDVVHRLRDEGGVPLGIVHRDINPANIMLTDDGEVKLIDFGIAKSTIQELHTKVGYFKGKYRYLAPEQARFEAQTARTDIFQLGVVLFELITLRHLFVGRSNTAVLRAAQHGVPDLGPFERTMTNVPKRVWSLLRDILEPTPEDRPTSMRAVEERLLQILYCDLELSEDPSTTLCRHVRDQSPRRGPTRAIQPADTISERPHLARP